MISAAPRVPLLIPVCSLTGGIAVAGVLCAAGNYALAEVICGLLVVTSLFTAYSATRRRGMGKISFRSAWIDIAWVAMLFSGVGFLTWLIHHPEQIDFEEDILPPLAVGVVEQCEQQASVTRHEVTLRELRHFSDSTDARRVHGVKVTLYSDALALSPGTCVAWIHSLRKNHYGGWYQRVSDNELVELESSHGLRYVALRIRDLLEIKLDKSGLSASAAAYVKAVALGIRDDMAEADSEIFRRGGMSHILALSGLHVGIVTAIICALLFPLNLLGWRKVRYLFAILLVWGYVIITGMGAPAVRAAVMASFLLVAMLLERRNSTLNALLGSVCVVVIADPSSVFAPGFRLSVAATAGILVFTVFIFSGRHRDHKWLQTASMAVGVAVVAFAFTAPLAAYHFHTFTPASLPSNILAGMLMPPYLVCALIYIGMTVTGLHWSVADGLLESGMQMLRALGEWSSESKANGTSVWISGWSVLCFYLAIGTLIFWLVKPQMRHGVVAAACIIIAVASLWLLPADIPADGMLYATRGGEEVVEIWESGNRNTLVLQPGRCSAIEKGRERVLWLDCGDVVVPGRYSAVIIGSRCTLTLEEIAGHVETPRFLGSGMLYTYQAEDYSAEALRRGFIYTNAAGEEML